ncbi:MAG: TetR/AcrR family transcriptional regulator [Rhodocyclaceae bacterium]|jgi:AcrR family transcriptional regulator|nr:TetR/AcrR family transcriptional regulator [Rhodocyclaceae bacterium]
MNSTKSEKSAPVRPGGCGSAARRSEELVLERVIQAAGACVERFGLEGATVEDIANESGISRATLYRKFGSKEAILDALIGQQAGPFVTEAIRILMGPGNIAVRIEEALICGVTKLPRQRWLEDAFANAVPSLGYTLFHTTYRQRIKAVLHLILQSGEVRPELDLEDTLDWFMRELVSLIGARPWDEQQLGCRIRSFVVPVLVPDRLRDIVSRAQS